MGLFEFVVGKWKCWWCHNTKYFNRSGQKYEKSGINLSATCFINRNRDENKTKYYNPYVWDASVFIIQGKKSVFFINKY
jgi:hypothetical protein